MALNVDPKIEPYYAVTFVLGSLVFCDDCRREAVYESRHPEGSDENYYDQAVALHADGWVVLPSGFRMACPVCAAKRGLRPPKQKLPATVHIMCGWPVFLLVAIGGAIGGGLGGAAYAVNLGIHQSKLPTSAKIALNIVVGLAAIGIWYAIYMAIRSR